MLNKSIIIGKYMLLKYLYLNNIQINIIHYLNT